MALYKISIRYIGENEILFNNQIYVKKEIILNQKKEHKKEMIEILGKWSEGLNEISNILCDEGKKK